MSDTDKQQEPTASEEATAEEATPDEATPDEATVEQRPATGLSPEEGSPEEGSPEEGSPEEKSPEEEPPEEESSEERSPEIEHREAPIEQEPRKAAGRALSWLALIVSATALAAVAYSLFLDWRAADDDTVDDTIATLERGQSENRAQLGDLDALVAELVGRDSVSATDIDTLRRQLEERVDLLSSLPARMSTLESSVASLAGISEGARDTWLLAEAEYYMQIANAQLQLANNPHLASLALAMADERVVQLANPALTDVRQAISDELAALAVMEKPDIAGTTMALASLARVVESLPVRSEAGVAEAAPEEVDEEQSGVGRAWSSVKGAMSGLIKVTPPDQADNAELALLTPGAEYLLRNNIALQLQVARLALLRGEQAIFEQSIDDTSTLLLKYFDTDSTQVTGALQTLEEIRGNIFATSAPDISGSLERLRQFQALRENSQ